MNEEKRKNDELSDNEQLTVNDKIQLIIHSKLTVIELKRIIKDLREVHCMSGERRGRVKNNRLYDGDDEMKLRWRR